MTSRHRGLIAAASFASVLAWMLVRNHNDGVEARVRDAETPGERSGAKSRFAQIRGVDRLLHQNPEEALALARRVASGSADAAERSAAVEKIPACLWSLYQRLAREKDYPAAAKIHRELLAGFGGSKEATWARTRWTEHRLDWADRAFADGDVETADRLYDEALRDSGTEPRHVFEKYRRYKLERWRLASADRGASNNALQQLMDAASVPPFGDRDVAREVAVAVPREDLLLTAEARLRDGKSVEAHAFFCGALAVRKAGPRGRGYHDEIEALEQRVAVSLLAVAHEARAGGLPWSSPGAVEDVYRRVPLPRDPEQRLELFRGIVAAGYTHAFALLEKGDYHQAEKRFRRLLSGDAWRVWEELTRQADFDGWARLPREVRERIEATHPGASPPRRLAALRKMVGDGSVVLPLPKARKIQKILPELYTRWGISELGRNVDGAFPKLRPVLRGPEDADRRGRIVEALQEATRKAVRENHFAAIFDLAGFYVAEVGTPGPGDAFRDELRDILVSAADHYRASSPMKRVFLLSLIAEVLPDDPVGKDAFGETMEVGMKVVARQRAQPMPTPSVQLPSGLGDLSVICIDNATMYHLLVFFDGPERFFARLDPMRRGSVVLKDGAYSTAVVVTSDNVRPSHGEQTFSSESRWVKYWIERRGGDSKPLLGGEGHAAAGDYELLRTPPGAPRLTVDSRTGTVKAVR